MDRDDAIAMLTAGKVKEWNAYRKEHSDWEPDLHEADLRDANLIGAKLAFANLDSAGLSRAKLQVAKLAEANLITADLAAADLSGADLSKVMNLSGANLGGAKLFNVKGLILDGHFIRDASFSPNASDAWSVLRRKYTGTAFLFHMMLLLAFVIPYAARTAMWVAVNRSQVAICNTAGRLQRAADKMIEQQDQPTAAVLRQIGDELAETEQSLTDKSRKWYVWQLLLAMDKGWGFCALAIALLLYNTGRGFLTRKVGAMRDEEERSGHAPAYYDYRRLFMLHRVVTVLWYVSVFTFGFHFYEWMKAPVYLPA